MNQNEKNLVLAAACGAAYSIAMIIKTKHFRAARQAIQTEKFAQLAAIDAAKNTVQKNMENRQYHTLQEAIDDFNFQIIVNRYED